MFSKREKYLLCNKEIFLMIVILWVPDWLMRGFGMFSWWERNIKISEENLHFKRKKETTIGGNNKRRKVLLLCEIKYWAEIRYLIIISISSFSPGSLYLLKQKHPSGTERVGEDKYIFLIDKVGLRATPTYYHISTLSQLSFPLICTNHCGY